MSRTNALRLLEQIYRHLVPVPTPSSGLTRFARPFAVAPTAASSASRDKKISHLDGNVERFTGFASLYEEHRPSPPPALTTLLTTFAKSPRPKLVVDIGSGTGLSSRLWLGKADEVIGIEPSDDMRMVASKSVAALRTKKELETKVSFQRGFGYQTGLPDQCADIVTVSQALHWMDPMPTFKEIRRVLRKGGVFAAFDGDWPPCTHDHRTDISFNKLMAAIQAIDTSKSFTQSAGHKKWDKESHILRMTQSSNFSFVKEVCFHHEEEGDAARFIGLTESLGDVQALLKRHVTARECGLEDFRREVKECFGGKTTKWTWTYRVRIGIA